MIHALFCIDPESRRRRSIRHTNAVPSLREDDRKGQKRTGAGEGKQTAFALVIRHPLRPSHTQGRHFRGEAREMCPKCGVCYSLNVCIRDFLKAATGVPLAKTLGQAVGLAAAESAKRSTRTVKEKTKKDTDTHTTQQQWQIQSNRQEREKSKDRERKKKEQLNTKPQIIFLP